MTQPPGEQPPYQQPYQQAYQPGYQQQQPYPPQYQPGYQGYAAVGGYRPPQRGGAQGALLWTWITFITLGVIGIAFSVVSAVRWVEGAARVGVPDNASATYGTVVGQQGSDLEVTVAEGTALLRRGTSSSFNQTRTKTSIERVGTPFTSRVSEAPPMAPGSVVAFSYSSDPTHGRYLAITATRIKNAARAPIRMIVTFVGGAISGLIGVGFFIGWLVRLLRRRRHSPPSYPAPPTYWQPSAPPR